MPVEEREAVLKGRSISVSYGSYEKEAISRSAARVEEDNKLRRWTGIAVSYFGIFVLYAQNSVYWTSMWPFLREIDRDVTEGFLGFVVSAYSFGMVCSAPLLGYWSNRIKQTRVPIITGTIINIIGNLLITFSQSLSSNQRWMLLGARFIAGIGAGSLGTIQAYVAMASTYAERNTAMALLAATLSLGILAGPGFQAAFVPLGYPGTVREPYLHLNMYTAPAFLNILLDLFMIICLIFVYKEYHIDVHEEEKEKLTDKTETKMLPIDKLAAINCIWVRFVMLFCIAYTDTIGSAFTIAMFNWSNETAVFYNSIIQAVCGFIDFCGNIFVGTFILRLYELFSTKERNTISIGVLLLMVFFLVSFSWPGQYLPEIAVMPLVSTISPAPTVDQTTMLNSTGTALSEGCNYSWCSYTPRVEVWQFVVAYVSITIAFSFGFSTNTTLYSKVLGPNRQGTMQGIYAAAGGLAMTVSPIMVSQLFESYGPRVTWSVAMAIIVLTILVMVFTYKRLVPYKEMVERITGHSIYEKVQVDAKPEKDIFWKSSQSISLVMSSTEK